MDIEEAWKQLQKVSTGNEASAAVSDAFNQFVDAVALLPSAAGTFPAPGSRRREELVAILRKVHNGSFYAEVGEMPQLTAALIVSLYHVAHGHKVFFFHDTPGEIKNHYKEFLRLCKRNLQVNVQFNINASKNDESALNRIFEGDIVFTAQNDYVCRFLNHDEAITPEDSVGIFCDCEFFLYGSRLFFHTEKDVIASAAVYKTRSGTPHWIDNKQILDFRDIAFRMKNICCFTSFISSFTRRQLSHVYGELWESNRTFAKLADITPLAFRNRDEKIGRLGRDIAAGEKTNLLFCNERETWENSKKEFNHLKVQHYTLNTTDQLINFLYPKGKPRPASSEPEVGMFFGLPALKESVLPDEKPQVNVVIGDHFPFDYHHAKIYAFALRYTCMTVEPHLYFSLVDAYTAFPEKPRKFPKAFHLADLVERIDQGSKMFRKRIGKWILYTLHSNRKNFFSDNIPLYTFINPKFRARPNKKLAADALKGNCFCGSGKPFAECHGKARGGGNARTK